MSLRKRGESLGDSNGWTDVRADSSSPTPEEFVHIEGDPAGAGAGAGAGRAPPRPPLPRASKLSEPKLSHPPPAYVATPKSKAVAAQADGAAAGAQQPAPQSDAKVTSSSSSSPYPTSASTSSPAPSSNNINTAPCNHSRTRNSGGGGGNGGRSAEPRAEAPPTADVEAEVEVNKTGWAFLDSILEEFAKVPQQQVSDHEAPFEARVLLANAERFMDAFSPFADAIDAVESIMHWEEPKLTGALFVVYVFFVLYAWVIPGVLLVALLSLGWAYAIRTGMVELDDDAGEGGDGAADSSVAASPSSAKKKSGFSKFFSGLSEKYTRARHQGQKVQNKFALYSQRAEKIVLLLDWSTPANTKVVAYVLVAAIILTAVIPAWLLGPILQVWFGVSFFIKAYVFNKYPALKAKYDSTYNFWCGLPDKTTVNYTVSPPAATAASAAGGGSKSSAAGNGKAKGKAAEVSAQPYSTTAGTVAAARSRAGQASNSNAAATATATATAASASASGSASSAAHAGSGAAAAAAVGAGVGGDSASDSIGSWSCVYLNDKVTASKAGRLVLSTTHVYFKTRDEGTSLFNVPLKDLVAVMPGDVLKASQEGKSSWLSSTLAKVGGKLGDKLGIGSLVLKVSAVEDTSGGSSGAPGIAAASHTFTTMPKRDEAGIAIGSAAPASVEYRPPTAKP